MRRIPPIFLLILFLLGTNSLRAQQSPQVIFDEANSLYQNGELSKALSLYRSIVESGQVSGAVYLNMGIAAVQMDSMGLAKYYFLKSGSFEETQQDALAALEYVDDQFSRRSATLPKLPWDRAVQWINESPGTSGLFFIGFLISVFGLVLLYLGWFQKLSFHKYIAVTTSLIASGIIIVIVAFYADYVDHRYDEAILITTSQRVLQQPNPEASLVSIAYEGYDLNVDHWESHDKEGWLYVRLGNGQFGWIQSESVRIL